MRQKGFAPLIIILVIVILGVVGYCGYRNHNQSGGNKDTSSSTIVVEKKQDNRDCIDGLQATSVSESLFVNKWFVDFAMSGEWGHIKQDGTIQTGWGLDYAGPNDTRPNSGTAKWTYTNGTLTISGSTISDGVYTDFKVYDYKGSLFAIPRESQAIVLGPSKSAIEDFFDNKIKLTWTAGFKCTK